MPSLARRGPARITSMNASTATRSRRPKGSAGSAGGQFAPERRGEADIDLDGGEPLIPQAPIYSDTPRAQRAEVMQADLRAAIKKVVDSGDLTRFLDMISSNRMGRYSFGNRLLILMQYQMWREQYALDGRKEDLPDLPFVMSAKMWKDTYGREIAKGTRAIWIRGFAKRTVKEDDPDNPGQTRDRVVGVSFPPVAVYDISQTDGPPVPATDFLPMAGERTDVEVAQAATAHLRERISALGYSVREEEIDNPGAQSVSSLGKHGYTTADGSKEVVVDSRLDEVRKAAVYAHEAGHIACGHVDGDYSAYREHRGRMETEAEVTSYLVARRLGIDSGDAASFAAPYIASWSKGDTKVLEEAFTAATKAAESILSTHGQRHG